MKPLMYIPYVKNKSQAFRRKLNKAGIKIGYKRHKNIGEILGKKGKSNGTRNTNVIYKVNCTCGEFYIGETGRDIQIRLDEHKKAVRKRDRCNGLAMHVIKTGHSIDFYNFEILDREAREWKRKIREAYFIRKLGAKLNLNKGVSISNLWL